MTASQIKIRRVIGSADPAIAAFGRLQNQIYFEPEMLIPAQYISQLLKSDGFKRQNVLLIAEDALAEEEGAELLGGTLFHYLPEAGTGFSSFLGVARSAREHGIARQLHEARWQALSEVSGGQCRAVFIDVVNPDRESPQQRQQEQEAGSDALSRRRSFHALGFRTVDLAYEQPVGGDQPELEGGGPVTDMDLLVYIPEQPETISAALAGNTMRAYWSSWLGPERADRAAIKLQGKQEQVRLLPADSGPTARS
jgi:hypothetical protein